MESKKKLLQKSRLYCVIDRKVCADKWSDFEGFILKIKKTGIDLIQYRDKESKKITVLENARLISKILSGSKTLFILNDYLDIAKISGCDGIHLGQDDVTLETARRIVGIDKIIGVSCHSLKQAKDAAAGGADYISIGPVFKTSTKPQYRPVGLSIIKELSSKIKIPLFVIGGINANNIKRVVSYGAQRVAVCRAICQAKNPDKIIKIIKTDLKKNR